MTSKFALKFLWIALSFLFVLLLAFTMFFIVKSVIAFTDNDSKGKVSETTFSYTAKGPENQQAAETFATDSTAKYKQVTDNYTVYITPRSAEGIYAFVSKLIFLLMAATALWQLINIFRKRTLTDPFHNEVIRRLKLLAWLFIIGDILKLADYYIFNGMARRFFPSQGFQQIVDFGNGLITGCIIWIIIVVLSRGQQLEEENALTV